MKNKVLRCIISFIFFAVVISNPLYAMTNEVIQESEILEDIQANEVTQEKEEKLNLEKQEENIPINDTIITTQLSEESTKEEIYEEIQYSGTMYLDSPVYHQSYAKPKDFKVKIEGWAVANDSQATIRVLLDGNILNNSIHRTQRGDVDTVISPQYGGISNTPKAGFYTEIELEKLSEGTHYIRVEEVSRKGECITSYDTCIKLEKSEYKATMNLENPMYNQSFTRPSQNKIKVEGWAVSNDSAATVRILLDGKVVLEKVNRNKRGDVDRAISPAYGGTSNTPKAGFSGQIDISNLVAGPHTLRVEELSRYGEVISSYETTIKIANQKYKGTMNLENPTHNKTFTKPSQSKIKVEGWAASNDSEATVRILVDGKVVLQKANRTKRGDVDKAISPHYGGTGNTPKAGFSGQIDIGNLVAGPHKIRVEELSRYGEVISSYEINIKVTNQKYKGTMNLENPTYNQSFTRPNHNKIKVEGWAVSNDSEAMVRILVDGKVVLQKANRTKRGDVDKVISPHYGGTGNTSKAGFSGQIDIGNFVAGTHKLRVEEVSRYGEVISSYEINIKVANQKYKGTMNLENPTYHKSFTKPEQTQIKIEGWAVSNDQAATMRILVDGKVVLQNVNRTKRGDVDSIISPAYGGTSNTPKAGFSAQIDSSNLTKGTHKLRVEEISRYGELISSYDIQIQIINHQYLGQMWLDAPTVNRQYNLGDNIAIDGWAVAQDEYASIEIYIDGNFKAKADRFNRSDVTYYRDRYGGKTINAGFGKLINSSGMTAGVHKIRVYQKSRYGELISSVETSISIKTPTKPNNNQTQTKPSTGNTNQNTFNPSPNIPTAGTKGIDVSQFQGTIDWKKVSSSGIQYAMIRIGYRGYATGGFAEDTKFKTNFQKAVQNGLKVGVYFYSTAINTTEAQKDAEYVVRILKKYGYQNQVSMPIAMDLELVSGVQTRDRNVTKNMRTNIANTFCQTIASFGYTPMIYACKSFLNDNMNASQLRYDVWVAQYNTKCTYQGKYTMWQYTSTGKVLGIQGNVDCNSCYKNY